MKRDGFWRSLIRVSLNGSLILAITLLVSGLAWGQACTPFGDPPDMILGDPIANCPSGGQRLGPWPDTSGTARYACLWTPSSASTKHPLPLVVFLHGGGGMASGAALSTNLLSFLNTANVSSDPLAPGFVLLDGPTAARLRIYTDLPTPGSLRLQYIRGRALFSGV